ncbi:MAG: LCP family protein [Patescibacteria group bacterium]|nr:LCP family protein [Patescibacteria group bacterium]
MEKQQAQPKKKTRIVWKGFFIRLALLAMIAIFTYGGFFVFKFQQLQNKIVVMAPIEDDEQAKESGIKSILGAAKNFIGDRPDLKGQQDQRINILLLGMGGEGHKGEYLTDTIMIVSIDPVTYKSAMLSIPRDLYTEIGDSNIYTKINAVYAYGKKNKEMSESEALSDLKKTIKNIIGQEIHYYVALDFEGFKNIIDEIGRVDIEVKDDIYDPSYPGPNYSYETFEISKGFHHLDAETALKYSRVRHIKGGDFGRAARQQQVIAAAKRKAFSIGTIANPIKISSIMTTLGDHLKTDIQLSEIPSFIHLVNNINIHETSTKVLDAWSADSLLGSTHVNLGGVPAYVLIPRAKNYSQVHELAENILDLGKIEKKKEAIENEDAEIAVIPQKKHSSYRVRDIMKKMGYSVKIESARTFNYCETGNKLLNFSDQQKLFTLDDLADKLDSSVFYIKDPNVKYDIIVCLSDETVEYFEKQNEKEEDEKKEAKQQSIVDEVGNVLTNK